MAKNSTGISLAEAWAASEQELSAESSTETPAVTQTVTAQPAPVAEQPAGNGEGVLIALKDTAGPTPVNTLLEDMDSMVVELDGERLTIAELKKGYLRQSDYTKKTTKAADTVREAENALALWKSLQEDPVNTVRKLSQRVNFGQPVTEEKQTVQGADLDELIRTKVNEALASDPDIQSTRQSIASSRVDSEFKRIEREWGVALTDEDKYIVLDTAQKNGSTDLEFTFAGLKSLADRKAEQRKQIANLSTATGSQGDPLGAAPKPDAPPKTFKEAVDQALKELRIEDLTRIS